MATPDYLSTLRRRPTSTTTGRTATARPAAQTTPQATSQPAAQGAPGFYDWLQGQAGFTGLDSLQNQGTLQDWVDRYQNRGTAPLSTDNPNSVVNGGTGGGAAPPASVTDQWNQVGQALQQQQQATSAPAPMNPLLDALAGQVLNPDGSLAQASVDPNDPTIRGQVDAFSAQQERARRLYLQEVAEASGPYDNIRGEQRMSAERLGQNVSGFEAELLGRELESQRNQLMQYLQVYGAGLSEQQRQQFQTQMALLEAQIRESEFSRRFGLDVETQQAYMDAVNRGMYRPE